MYERSAIVLERYFEKLLDYRNKCNIRDNFSNYCKLVEKLEKYQINYEKEAEATDEFRESVNKIKSIQAAQEKLYKKSAKLEYNRNLLFGNVEGKVEETRRCIEKIEEDVAKNNEAMKDVKEQLIAALEIYNQKRFELSKCKRYKKIAENEYNEILEISQTNFDGITGDVVKAVKAFSGFDDVDDIVNTLDRNGKDEKIPFNEGVIECATSFGVELAKKEAVGYLVIYDKMSKLLADIKAGTTRIDLHKKYLRNEKAKMDFLMSAKNYLVQFLDYERMTVIYGRKSHNRLMSEACESFSTDVAQINNLYELLLMEIANKATKKAYKSLYNKSYLIDIQEQEEKFKKEKSRVNLNTATLINSNYWRIEGIKAIYTVFYKIVIDVFGREVEEFDIPKETDEDQDEAEDIAASVPALDSYGTEKESSVVSIPFAIKVSGSEDTEDDSNDESYEYSGYEDMIDDVADDLQENVAAEDFDIFGEKYRENDFVENLMKEEIASRSKAVEINTVNEDKVINVKPAVNNEVEFAFDKYEEEEPLFSDIKSITRKKNVRSQIEDLEVTKDDVNPPKILKTIRKTGNTRKKGSESNIW